MMSIRIFWGDDAKMALMEGSIVKNLAPGLILVDVARSFNFGDHYAADLEEEVPPQLAVVIIS
jgi:hypothetical protein